MIGSLLLSTHAWVTKVPFLCQFDGGARYTSIAVGSGASRIRTGGLRLAKAALCQLSYGPSPLKV